MYSYRSHTDYSPEEFHKAIAGGDSPLSYYDEGNCLGFVLRKQNRELQALKLLAFVLTPQETQRLAQSIRRFNNDLLNTVNLSHDV